jgi:hypothetical protein
MLRRREWIGLVLCCLVAFAPAASGQSTGAQLTGSIVDPTGAMVPGAEVTLTSVETGVTLKTASSPDGLYSFFNLTGGHFELRVTVKGFREYVQKGLRIGLNEKARIDVKLELGAESQQVEVNADASALNYETVEQSGGVAPDTVNELPLIITSGSGGLRSAAQFMSLMPGVVSQDGDVITARMNGAQKYSGDALLNGVALTNPSGGNGTYSAAYDFGQSPEMVSELKIITANYEPQYGSTGGSIFIMETKAGTNQFHGNAFWYHRNDALNARQWNVDERPRDLEHDFGGSIGGPAKLPLLWSSKNKTYFFFNFEGFRQKGGASRSILSIPSMQEREGDFRDWKDAEGNLIPIYDPATTRTVNGEVVRDQFMGCDGNTPNVICSSDPRLQNSLAKAWFKYLPEPTFPGTQNNFVALDVPTSFYSHTNHYNIRVDEYLGDKDHFFLTVYHRKAGPAESSELPKEISNGALVYKQPWVDRLSWDHTFSPVLLNHFAAGYQDDYYNGGSLAAPYADLFPKIPGAARNTYPPTLTFSDDFQSYKGDDRGTAEANKWPAPSLIFNDLLTWVKGKHTFKMGAEYRTSANTYVFERNEAGTLHFDRGQTGLLNVNSGSPVASFLLEQVDSGSVDWRPYGLLSARFQDYIAHFGDTWKVTPKLSLNLGLRWEMHPPTHEVHDVWSFLDPYGSNPGAGGRPGRLAFAGTRWGDVSYGKRYPEQLYKKAFSPRLGIAYSVSPKMVVRTGYGIFYDAAITPGWEGGLGRAAGFNLSKQFGNSLGGLAPAFVMSEGFPTNYQKPPFLDPTYVNGQGVPVYRPLDSNRLPYTQQWNLNVEREFTSNFYISAAYVGTKGTRLYSRTAPLNVLDPKLMSMGNALYEEFQPGQTELNGVQAPYEGWAEQMTGCAPSVAQALLPYPQYCGSTFGLTENAGNSTFHSLQIKAEKRFSNGFWFLGSYTLSKLITDAETTQADEALWGGGGVISPFERHRNKALSEGDVPQTLVLSLVYDLPVGKGRRWMSNANPFLDGVLGGWRVSSIFRITSGTPFYFRSGQCNIPGQFGVGCIPAILPGSNPFAQDQGNFDPSRPLFNVAAFEPVDRFNFYSGVGPRVSNLRGFGYHNQDVSITKKFRIREGMDFQVRGDFFNFWNWHLFRSFSTYIDSTDFGMQQGPSSPRFVQVGAKINF